MNIVFQMVPHALMIATPIIIAALGGMFSERSGIVNIALEGIMMVGAFVAATATVQLEVLEFGRSAAWISLLFAILAGLIYSILLGIATITFNADQTIAGTAINLLSGGITVYLCQIIFNQQRTETFRNGISRLNNIPYLSNIPIIGDLFFKSIYPTVFIAILLVFISYYLVFKTSFGLRLRSCGENPQASASMGINVGKMRYVGVLISGALSGLAGGIMVLTMGTQFSAASVHGYGFIAIAALIFGKWNPFGVLGAGVFFGFSQVLGAYASHIPVLKLLPSEFYSAVPYVFTIIALILFSGKTVGPKAAGEIYDSGKR